MSLDGGDKTLNIEGFHASFHPRHDQISLFNSQSFSPIELDINVSIRFLLEIIIVCACSSFPACKFLGKLWTLWWNFSMQVISTHIIFSFKAKASRYFSLWLRWEVYVWWVHWMEENFHHSNQVIGKFLHCGLPAVNNPSNISMVISSVPPTRLAKQLTLNRALTLRFFLLIFHWYGERRLRRN